MTQRWTGMSGGADAGRDIFAGYIRRLEVLVRRPLFTQVADVVLDASAPVEEVLARARAAVGVDPAST